MRRDRDTQPATRCLRARGFDLGPILDHHTGPRHVRRHITRPDTCQHPTARQTEPPRLSRRRSRWAFHAAMAASSSCSEQRAPAAAGGTGPMGPRRRRRWSSRCARSRLRADLRFGGGEPHRLEAAPGAPPADRLGLEEPDHGLGRRGVERAPRPAPPDLRPRRARRRPRRGAPRTGGRGAGGPRPSARPAPRARRGPARVGGLLERAQPEARGGAAAHPPGPRCAARRRRSQRPCGQSPAGPPRGACPRGGGGEGADPRPTRGRPGAGAGDGRLARSGGPGAAGSRTVVLTAPPSPRAPRCPMARIRRSTVRAGRARPPRARPAAGARKPPACTRMHPRDPGARLGVAPGARRGPGGVAASRQGGGARPRGDRQPPADPCAPTRSGHRLDPVGRARIVDEGDHRLSGRSSAARARGAEALRRMTPCAGSPRPPIRSGEPPARRAAPSSSRLP